MAEQLEPLFDGTVLEKLERGLEILTDPNRWIRKAYHDGAGGHCIYGACGSDDRHPFDNGVDSALRHAISCVVDANRFMLYGRLSVSVFNDNPTTTHGDILAVLRKAVADAEAIYT